jgi:hypothetical protein
MTQGSGGLGIGRILSEVCRGYETAKVEQPSVGSLRRILVQWYQHIGLFQENDNAVRHGL